MKTKTAASTDDVVLYEFIFGILTLHAFLQVVRPVLLFSLEYQEITTNTNYPIYKRGQRLSQWAGIFCRDLVSRAQGTRKDLFSAVKSVIKQMPPIALYILPHVIFNVVCHGSDGDREIVRGELLKVRHRTHAVLSLGKA